MITAQEEKGFSRQALWEPGPGGTILRAQRVRTQWKQVVSDRISSASPTAADAAAREEFVKLENLDPALPFRTIWWGFSAQNYTVAHFVFALRFWIKGEEVLSIPIEHHSAAYPTDRVALAWPFAGASPGPEGLTLAFQYTGGNNQLEYLAPRSFNVTCDRISVKIVSMAGSTYGSDEDARIFLVCRSTNYTG